MIQLDFKVVGLYCFTNTDQTEFDLESSVKNSSSKLRIPGISF